MTYIPTYLIMVRGLCILVGCIGGDKNNGDSFKPFLCIIASLLFQAHRDPGRDDYRNPALGLYTARQRVCDPIEPSGSTLPRRLCWPVGTSRHSSDNGHHHGRTTVVSSAPVPGHSYSHAVDCQAPGHHCVPHDRSSRRSSRSCSHGLPGLRTARCLSPSPQPT